MSDLTRNLTLERVNRLQQAVADLMESQTAQGREINRMLSAIAGHLDAISGRLGTVDGRLATIEKVMANLASEQALLGNRVQEAFSRALRTNIRLDEIEYRAGSDGQSGSTMTGNAQAAVIAVMAGLDPAIYPRSNWVV